MLMYHGCHHKALFPGKKGEMGYIGSVMDEMDGHGCQVLDSSTEESGPVIDGGCPCAVHFPPELV